MLSEFRVRTPPLYKFCDGLTEAVIYFMVVFSPWAFGTTQDWSIWTMNVCGYLLGALLVAKWLVRWKTGFQLERWGREGGWRWETGGGESGGQKSEAGGRRDRETVGLSGGQTVRPFDWARGITIALAGLTVLVLGYCWVSAVNARATVLADEISRVVYRINPLMFEYYDAIKWLPHSYDKPSTWKAFWNYLALAWFFWGTRDWLLGKSTSERRDSTVEGRAARDEHALPVSSVRSPEPRRHSVALAFPRMLPNRLRCLLWVICINGAVLAVEAILQRISGTQKLLWLIEPLFGGTESRFGPYAYRSNAAQYLNLVWPLCLGFWILLRTESKGRRIHILARRSGSYVILPPCVIIVAAASVFSASRGGAIITICLLFGATTILWFAAHREKLVYRIAILAIPITTLAVAGFLGLNSLQKRFQTVFSDSLQIRRQIYQNAERIAQDFPYFGTGPGTFGSIYRMYKEPQQVWEAYAHNDWLETQLTFGWIGFSLILLMLGLTLARSLAPTGIAMPRKFATTVWLALGGCLLHARFDFPLQIYSILHLFVTLCSVLFCLSLHSNSTGQSSLKSAPS